MLKICYPLLIILIAHYSSAQKVIHSDTLHYEKGVFDTGYVKRFNYRKHYVLFTKNNHSIPDTIEFRNVQSISLAGGKMFLKKIRNGEPRLMISFISGEYGLLFDEPRGHFFVEHKDSLFYISKDYINRALPVIFGSDAMRGFYALYGKHENYSYKYFLKIISYVNAMAGNGGVVADSRNIEQFTSKWYLGPFVSTSVVSTRLRMIGDLKKDKELISTGKFYRNVLPVGIQLAVSITPRWHIQLNSYYFQIFLADFQYAWGSYEMVDIPDVIKSKYNPVPLTRNYSYFSFNNDISLKYFPVRPGGVKILPFVFAGPSICILKNHQMEDSILYQEAGETSSCDFWYRSHTKELMVALHFGLGFNYNLGGRWSFDVFGKFQGGVYPRALLSEDLVSADNTSPFGHEHFDKLNFASQYRFDQISRILSAGAGVYYQF